MIVRPEAFGFRPFEFGSVYSACTKSRQESRSSYSLLVMSKNTIVWAEDCPNEGRVVYKLYHHRGPISWCREAAFRFRVQREFEALSYLVQAKIPCSEPLYWSAGLAPGLGRSELLVTREVPQSMNLEDFLLDDTNLDQIAKFKKLYRLIRDMHRAGFYHGALWTRNILLTPDFSYFIIDTPSSMKFGTNITNSRMACYDLLNLTSLLLRIWGSEVCIPLLVEYGMDTLEAKRFIETLSCYAPTRHLGNRLRAEFGVRELLSKLSDSFLRRTEGLRIRE